MQTAAPQTSSGTDPLHALLASAAPVPPQRHRALAGKRVLITGAGGSIGSALALAAHASAPSSLVLLDTSEAALYQLDRELRTAGLQLHTPILGSVSDRHLLAHIFAEYRPQVILHAAALKHVPLMEQNPFAAIATNVLGTHSLTEAALAGQAEHLVLVSTDKAVDPHSIMGASKRIAELILLNHGTRATRMSAIRLCNVIGSQGSVLPLFLDQIERHLPITVTHPDARRYFISLEVAVSSILATLQSASAATILIPDLPRPMRIFDLARHLATAHSSSSPIIFTGLRPGDKMVEDLLSARERRSSRPVVTEPDLYAVEAASEMIPSLAALRSCLHELREATFTFDLPHLLRAIQMLVPEYHPSSALTAGQNALEVHA